jgi:hypothetical protein
VRLAGLLLVATLTAPDGGGDGRELETLGDRLRHADGQAANEVANALHARGAAALPIFLEVLGDRGASSEARAWASYYLREVAPEIPPASVDRLLLDRPQALTVALADPSEHTRQLVLRLLYERALLPRVVLPRVLEMVSSGGWQERAYAALVLRHAPAAEAVPALTAALGVKNFRLNLSAALALGHLGPAAKSVTSPLGPLQRHWHPRVRRAAEWALASVEGRPTAVEPPHPETDYSPTEWGDHNPCSVYRVWEVEKDGLPLALISDEKADPRARTRLPQRFRHPHQKVSALDVDGGTLFGLHRGEWGGELLFADGAGRTTQLSPYKVHRLTRLGRRTVALVSVSYGGGAILDVHRDAGGAWRAEPLVELPSQPVLSRHLPDGTLLAATGDGTVSVSEDGEVRLLGCGDAAPEVAAVLTTAFAHPRVRAALRKTLPEPSAPLRIFSSTKVPFYFEGRPVEYVQDPGELPQLQDVTFTAPGPHASVYLLSTSPFVKVELVRRGLTWRVTSARVSHLAVR